MIALATLLLCVFLIYLYRSELSRLRVYGVGFLTAPISVWAAVSMALVGMSVVALVMFTLLRNQSSLWCPKRYLNLESNFRAFRDQQKTILKLKRCKILKRVKTGGKMRLK